ncbi:neuroligin-4, X-linked-like isoform X1 [Tetranychus urticae]|uniref:neuroligin-4, X-linked-like isoform X1 n=1 Tax=Tetranychus urticae TaxID=32264 RepID=UPI00077BF9E9|nr:neuroligin-4, X-linked-like isoform X1 [Tetranychus urticae]
MIKMEMASTKVGYKPSSITPKNVIYKNVKCALIVFLITNLTVFWLNCVITTVSADYSTNRRPSNRIISTKYGSLRGVYVNLPHNLQPIEMFLGIPYASPPVGKLRFMPPVTPAPWNGIKNADNYGPVCPQRLPNLSNETDALLRMTSYRLAHLKRLVPLLQNQSEDCLYLNIYLPAKASQSITTLYPVIMFIHGESYEWNSGSVYDGSILSSFGEVIVVTINYRLGALGFFPSLDGTSRGNFGLMDQVAALHWIQENIGEFGGSSSNVTIFGHDYGASFVNLLMLSPMGRGLFQRAIMSSGSALSPFSMATDSIKYSKILADRVGCTSDNNKNTVLLNCLRKKSLDEIMSVSFDVPKHLTLFGPTVDGIVIPGDPLTLMTDETSLFGSYELLTGVTRVEYFHSFTDSDVHQGIEPSKRDRIIRTLVRNLYDYHLQEIYLTISNEYTDWTRPTSHPLNILDSLTDLLSDSLVVAPLIKVATLHSRRPKKTYFYSFLYSTEEGDYPSRLGCVSGQELNYLFGAPLISGLKLSHFSSSYTRSEIALSETLITNWVAFAKYGDPNNKDDLDMLKPNNSNNNYHNYSNINRESRNNNNRIDKITWPIYEEHQQQYYALTIKPKLRDHYHAHRMSYWLNLIPKLHVPGSSANQDHHLLHNHGDLSTYDGIVRANRLPILLSPSSSTSAVSPSASLSPSSVVIGESGLLSSSYPNSSITHPGLLDGSSLEGVSSSSSSFSGDQRPSALDSNISDKSSSQSSNSIVNFFGTHVTYTTALSVTIAIGCSLLILNVLIFAGFFYTRDLIKSKKSSNSNNDKAKQKSDEDENRWQLSKETDRSTISYYPESNFICPSETLTGNTGNQGMVLNNGPNDIQMDSSGSPLPVHHWISSSQQQQQQQQSIACSNFKGYQLHPFTSETIDILQTGHHVSLNNCTYTATINPSTVGNVEKNLTNLMDTSSLVIDDHKGKSIPNETGI